MLYYAYTNNLTLTINTLTKLNHEPPMLWLGYYEVSFPGSAKSSCMRKPNLEAETT